MFTSFLRVLIPAAPIKVERHAAGFPVSPHLLELNNGPEIALKLALFYPKVAKYGDIDLYMTDNA
jgi:hypothetical protein